MRLLYNCDNLPAKRLPTLRYCDFIEMKTVKSIIVLILLHNLTYASDDTIHNVAEQVSHQGISKRFDFLTCASNFKISENIIIRTTDSKAMGAEFLNEKEVNSREDCLKWCCDTDKCDVIVFEEKVTLHHMRRKVRVEYIP